MKMMKRYIIVLFTLLLAAIVLSVTRWLPLGYEPVEIVSPTDVGVSIPLYPGSMASQEYRARGGWQNGFTFYTTSHVLTNQRFTARVVDRFGQERARTAQVNETYLPADDTIVLNFHLPWFRTKPNEHLIAQIILDQGDPLWLRVANRDIFHNGTAQIDNHIIDRDLPLDVRYAATLNTPAQKGVLAAVILLAGLSAILVVATKESTKWIAAGALLTAVTPLALSGFLGSLVKLGISDWDLYFSYHEVIRRTVLFFHVFPFWNPWLCGGTAALADPEFPFFTLTFLLELLFGIPLGVRLAIFLSIAATAIGMLMLARRSGLSLLGAVVAAVGTAFSSVSLLEIVEGHVNVLAAMWLPWIFWAWLGAYRKIEIKKLENRRPLSNNWSLVCGIFLAATFYAGGIYLLMYTGLAFILLLFLVRRPRRAWRVTATAGGWALGFASLKLIPVLLWLRQFPDQIYAGSSFTLPWLDEILFGRHLHGSNIIFNQQSGWHEYGAYIGYAIFTLALVGVSRMARNRIVRGLAIAAVAAILLSSAGSELKPVFDQIPYMPRSNISRFILMGVIPLSLLAGFGLDYLVTRAAARRQTMVKLTAWGLFSIATLELMTFASMLSYQSFVLPPVEDLPKKAAYPILYTAESFSTMGQGDRHTRSYAAILQDYGTLTYCSVLGPPPQVRTIHDEVDYGIVTTRPNTTKAELKEWTPNKAVFAVAAEQDSRIVLNANYAVGWYANNQPAIDDSGRVAVDIMPGTKVVSFTYRAPGFWLGLAITLLTITACAWQLIMCFKKSGVK